MDNEEQQARSQVISNLEAAINDALIVFGDSNDALRQALLRARGDVREAIGEART